MTLKRVPLMRKTGLKRVSFLRSASREHKAVAKLRSKGPKMTPIRKSARDEECTLRFPGICNYRTDTTVLCHRNGAGAGMKASDLDAVYGCHACHMVLDGQAPRPEGFTREAMLGMFEQAIARTHARLEAKGLKPVAQNEPEKEAA